MISDVSYRSRDTPCDQGRTRGRANDQKRATHAYLVPQSSPVWQAITAQPAAARPEPPLRVAGSPRSCSACARPARWCPRAAQAAGLRSGPAGCGKRRVFAGGPARAARLGWAIGGGQHARERADRCMDRERRQTGCEGGLRKFELQLPRTFRSRERALLVDDDGRGPRGGSCPGIPGQLPSEEPLTGPTGSSKQRTPKVKVATRWRPRRPERSRSFATSAVNVPASAVMCAIHLQVAVSVSSCQSTATCLRGCTVDRGWLVLRCAYACAHHTQATGGT